MPSSGNDVTGCFTYKPKKTSRRVVAPTLMAAGGGQDIILSDFLTDESSIIHTYVHMDGPGETHWVRKQKTKPQTKQRHDSGGGTS